MSLNLLQLTQGLPPSRSVVPLTMQITSENHFTRNYIINSVMSQLSWFRNQLGSRLNVDYCAFQSTFPYLIIPCPCCRLQARLFCCWSQTLELSSVTRSVCKACSDLQTSTKTYKLYLSLDSFSTQDVSVSSCIPFLAFYQTHPRILTCTMSLLSSDIRLKP